MLLPIHSHPPCSQLCSFAQECVERDEFTDPISAYEYFYNLYANGGNVSQTDLDCAETVNMWKITTIIQTKQKEVEGSRASNWERGGNMKIADLKTFHRRAFWFRSLAEIPTTSTSALQMRSSGSMMGIQIHHTVA